jgi:hypothetical protein
LMPSNPERNNADERHGDRTFGNLTFHMFLVGRKLTRLRLLVLLEQTREFKMLLQNEVFGGELL